MSQLTFQQVRDNARGELKTCKVCRECNGEACRGLLPGVGGKGNGESFVRNYKKLQSIKLHLDTMYDQGTLDTSVQLFGKSMSIPVFAGPMAAIDSQFGPKYDTETFQRVLLQHSKDIGTVTFLPGSPDEMIARLCSDFPGQGIPTIKPWPIDVVIEKAQLYEKAGAFAIATDLDGAGLAAVQGGAVPVMPHGVENIKKLVAAVNIPVIIKGVMTVAGAKKCVKAGVAGIVVSNHGGRVMEQALSTAEVLGPIAEAVAGRMPVLVDGGIRTGADLFKIRALGAQAAIIGRPFGVAVFGGDMEGIHLYTKKLETELREAMMMTGAETLEDICAEMIHIPKDFY